MKNLCSIGHKISNADQKALSNYLLVTPKEWANLALKGMINKAVKSILRDYLEIYKATQTGDIPGDYAIIIPAIIAMGGFIPYNIEVPEIPIIDRKEVADQEIWTGGFDVEDYENDALEAYYANPEEQLQFYMENKVFQRKKAFIKEEEPGFFERKEAIPVRQDDFINVVCAKPGYKDAVAREAERIAALAK